MVTKIALSEPDLDEGQRSRHERICAQRVEGSKIGARSTQRIRDQHVVESKVGAREHEIIQGEVPGASKIEKMTV